MARSTSTRRWIVAVASALSTAMAMAGCSGGDDTGTTTGPGGATSLPPGAASTSSAAGGGSAAPTTVLPTSTTLAPVNTGVVGIDSAEPVCAAFARINGTYQLLAVAAAFGSGGEEDLARIEMVSAPSVVAAADALFAAWPQELDAERSTAQDDLVGPVERRAERAVQALRDAGATAADLATLDGAWAGVLAGQERGDPDVALPELPAALDAIVAGAAATFAAEVTAFAEDPSLLRVDVVTPLTDAWLVERCPEVMDESGSDAV